jgi:hypothetical protein
MNRFLYAYEAWRSGTSNRGVVPARQAGNRFLGSIKGLQIRAHIAAYCVLSSLFFLSTCAHFIRGQSLGVRHSNFSTPPSVISQKYGKKYKKYIFIINNCSV